MRHQIGTKEVVFTKPEITVKTVCNPCNNGWMSALEAECIPLIGSMMQGVTVPLSEDQQRLVAVWATKTAMMMDSIKGREAGKRFYTRAECEQLRAERVIPDDTRIWLGQYIGDGTLGGFGTDFTVVAAELGMQRVARGMANTIVVGRLVLQIVTIHRHPEHLHRNISDVQPKPGDWQDLLVPICPSSRTVEWPPKHPFANNEGAHGIGRLMERWRIGAKVDQLP